MASVTAQVQALHNVRLVNGQSFAYASSESQVTDKIPLIDVSRMLSEDIEQRKAVAEEIRDASSKIGFFTIINHGIDMNLAADVFDQAKLFFALPDQEKMEVCTDLMPDEFCGYHPMHRYNINQSQKKDLSEAFNWNYDASRDPGAPDPSLPSINLWPKGMPVFHEKLSTYQTAMIGLARRLTRLFALALHVPEDTFDNHVLRPEAGMRILHYPEQTASRDDQRGIGAHTDVECFTIITADSEGLEVLDKSGQWLKVQPVQDAFVVNIADCFMRQTNDFFVSTVHRVINKSGKARYSAPFFWGFDRETLLTPVPTCVNLKNPPRYPIMTAGEYYLYRTRKQKKQWRSDYVE